MIYGRSAFADGSRYINADNMQETDHTVIVLPSLVSEARAEHEVMHVEACFPKPEVTGPLKWEDPEDHNLCSADDNEKCLLFM